MTQHSDSFPGALAGTWRQAVGTWATSSGAVQCADVQGSTGKYLIDDALDVGASDMYARGRILSTQVNSGSNTGPAVRHRASVVTGYQFAANLNDSHGGWRTVAGSETQIGSFTAAVALNDLLGIEAAGRTLRYKVNDAVVAFLQDTNITDGQRGALNGYNGAASGDLIRVDDYDTGLLTDLLVAPFVAGWTPMVEGVGTTLTPVFSDVQAGDTLVVLTVIRDAAQTVTAPGSEGWSASVQTPSQTGLEGYVFAKRWGLGGQTDDSTPTFSIGSGTAGWIAAGVLIRNPLHASAPWTSATHAIVASGSQSNASSTTVTAPSVSHTGNNRTVLRLFGSGDDNALNAPSTGALIFGGAAFDSTQGNDEAMAASVRENITVTTNTGTSTVTQSAVGPDISFGITLVLAVPTGTAVTGAGQVTGTGSISGAGVRGVTGSGTVSGTGAISGQGVRGVAGAGTVGGTGSITGTGQRGVTGAATVTGSGAVSAAGVRGVLGAAQVAGTAQIEAQGLVGRAGAGEVVGVGAIGAAGVRGVTGAGTVAGVGAISASGVVTQPGTGQGQVTGTGTIGATGVRGVLGAATVGGAGAIAAAGVRGVTGSGSVTGVGSITGRGVRVGDDATSQGSWDTGRRQLIYDNAPDGSSYGGRGRLVYDP